VRSIRTIIYTQKKTEKQPTPNGKPSHQSWLDGLNNTSSNNNPSARLVFIPKRKTFLPFLLPCGTLEPFWGGQLAATFYVYEFDDEGINQIKSKTPGRLEEAFSGAWEKRKA
jgi:hypothetical protein